MNNSNTELESFDVFLCHNSEDKPEIRRIADDLTNRKIKVWLDEREIQPGTLWQTALEEQITCIKSAAVFVGEAGIGPWENMEIKAFINEFVVRKCPIIPAILPSAKKTPQCNFSISRGQIGEFKNVIPYFSICCGLVSMKLPRLIEKLRHNCLSC